MTAKTHSTDSIKNENRDAQSGFDQMVETALSRRNVLSSSTALGLSAFVINAGLSFNPAKAAQTLMGFKAIPASTKDAVTVPKGYSSHVVVSWGDPIFPESAPFDQETRGTAASQKLAFGDNNDGMWAFPIDPSRTVLAVNCEYVNADIFYGPRETEDQGDPGHGDMPAYEVQKAKAAHGISIVEIIEKNGKWSVDTSGKRNRRITADSPMIIDGPAKGDDLLKTSADPTGAISRGTWNNCGSGTTPWGTYLTCEENFNLYFGTDNRDFKRTPEQKAYGLKAKETRSQWYKFDKRFDLHAEPNEAHRAGYVVEIDPMDPSSTPRKHTALGRLKHENAAVALAKNNRVVVYMGDDERGQYLYKFVSKGKFVIGDAGNNRRLLEDGTLFVARFGNATRKLDGKGEWVELAHGKNGLTAANGFKNQAAVLVFARKAAAQVAATTMDRPEWVAVNPKAPEAYCALTNNKYRGSKKNSLGVEQTLNGPNPREKNKFGQIVRLLAAHEDHASKEFSWSLFVLAGNPTNQQGLNKGTENITEDNLFNGPDGLAFDDDERLWIQTDGKYSNKGAFKGMGNNQMLCGDPKTGEIRRFMTGPVACEVTGMAWSPDKRTMFINIQHPGVRGKESHFPNGGETVPRSSVIAIRKDDGGIIGT